MAPRVLLQMVLAILLAAAVAGCTDAPNGGDRAPGGDGADAPEEEDLGPLSGVVPGVEKVPLPVGQPGALEGYVYDLENGAPIGDATVTATCLRQAAPGTDPATSRTLPVDATGRFALEGTGAFADCLTVTYTIEAPGYTIQVPLESGPIVPGVQYLVYGGMTPQP